jgi:hypothetical protein
MKKIKIKFANYENATMFFTVIRIYHKKICRVAGYLAAGLLCGVSSLQVCCAAALK